MYNVLLHWNKPHSTIIRYTTEMLTFLRHSGQTPPVMTWLNYIRWWPDSATPTTYSDDPIQQHQLHTVMIQFSNNITSSDDSIQQLYPVMTCFCNTKHIQWWPNSATLSTYSDDPIRQHQLHPVMTRFGDTNHIPTHLTLARLLTTVITCCSCTTGSPSISRTFWLRTASPPIWATFTLAFLYFLVFFFCCLASFFFFFLPSVWVFYKPKTMV